MARSKTVDHEHEWIELMRVLPRSEADFTSRKMDPPRDSNGQPIVVDDNEDPGHTIREPKIVYYCACGEKDEKLISNDDADRMRAMMDNNEMTFDNFSLLKHEDIGVTE